MLYKKSKIVVMLLFGLMLSFTPAFAEPPDESSADKAKPAVTRQIIMFVVDGLQAKALQNTSAPNINGLGSAGIRANQVNPVFPDSLLASFVSMMVGSEPEQHGCLKPGDSVKGDLLPALLEQQEAKSAFFDGTGTLKSVLRNLNYVYTGPAARDSDVVDAALGEIEKNKPFFSVLVLPGSGKAMARSGADSAEYLRAVTEADNQIGRVLNRLHQDGTYEKTLLVVTGTAGVPPLIMKGIDFKAGFDLPPVNLTDIAPTIAYLQGVKMPQATGLVLWNALQVGPGRSEIYLLHERVKDLSESNARVTQQGFRLLAEKVSVQEEQSRLNAEKTSYQRAIQHRDEEINKLGLTIKVYRFIVMLILVLFLVALLFQYKVLKKRFLFFS